MNTSALKSFSQEARQILRESVEHRLKYWGFDKKGNNTEKLESVSGGYTFRGKVSDDTSVPPKWNKLKAAISNTSFDEVVEKAAYTWFNRLLAMKILSKNGYETAQVDYLSDETNTPAILERARRGQYPFLTAAEKQRLQPLLTDYENEQETFAILLIGYCHQHPLLQGIFGSIDDYTELLLPGDILTENGFLYFLNSTEAISEEDYKQVELIGWLYQFYVSEKKDEVFASFKQKKKAEAKDIPAATQIFTPNWIVKYLVQNTVGRTWLDAHPDSDLKAQWKYLVDQPTINKEQTTTSPESLTFLDPAVGSGHILIEAFDTLYPIYLAEYYSPEEAVKSILQKNLYGLDLDLRAVQLAQFALIIKASQYSRTVLQGKLLPHVYAMPQPRLFSIEEVKMFLGKDYTQFMDELYKDLQTMEQANNLGSIMILELSEDARKAIEERRAYWQNNPAKNLDEEIIKEVFPSFIPILLILTTQFVCIAANPPYMGHKNMNAALKNYVNRHYSLGKSDLMTVFIEMFVRMVCKKGRFGFITPPSWMFLSTYEELRNELLTSASINSLLHLSRGVFGADFGSVATVIQKTKPNSNTSGNYFRLVERTFQEFHHWHLEELFSKTLNNPDFKFLFKSYEKDSGVTENNESGLKVLYSGISQANFVKIPCSPIAYWVSERMLKIFSGEKMLDKVDVKQGLASGDNERFFRLWFEVSFKNFQDKSKSSTAFWLSKKKWCPINKGGTTRKWYGNQDYAVSYDKSSREILKTLGNKLPSENYYFKPTISWSDVFSGQISFKYFPEGFIFNNKGNSIFFQSDSQRDLLLAYCNSNLFNAIVSSVNPTLTFSVGDFQQLYYPKEVELSNQVQECINIAKSDWNSRETSWDFQTNPLIATKQKNIEQSYGEWQQMVSITFFQLHAAEERINRIFIETYGLQEELAPDVLLKDITILQDELDYYQLELLQKPYDNQLVPVNADAVMQQLISYAVGCYMGRYRLDKPGLYIAHPNPTEDELVQYAVNIGENRHFLFQMDDDAIIPLMGNNGNFTDDMLHRIKEFLSIVWGEETLTANLNFLQQHLGKDLEDYLVKDFWKYHNGICSKKPIYWLFASKKSAFQVLVCMHRMNAYTVAKIRSKYLIPHISWLQAQVRDMEKNAAILNRTELKKLDILRKQLDECEEYDLLLKDLSDKQISFDLDDGVTRNYALFKGVVAEVK